MPTEVPPEGAPSTPSSPPPRRTSWWRPPGAPSRGWMVGIVAAVVLAAGLGGVTVYHAMERPEMTLLEIYITDLPADFSRLDVRVAGVYVGDQRFPLNVDRPNFNLLALQGPEDALRVARGQIPAGDHREIHLVFESARAELDRKKITAEIPQAELVVSHDFQMGPDGTHSLLFDIDVNQSLSIEGPSLLFRPKVASVYVHAGGALGSGGSDEPAPSPSERFTETPAEKPKSQVLVKPDPSVEPRPPAWTTTATSDYDSYKERYEYRNESYEQVNDTDNSTNDNETDSTPLPTLKDSNSVPADYARTVVGWFVQFAPGSNETKDMEATIEAYGADLMYRLGAEDAAYILATPPEAEELYYDPNVTWVEPDQLVDLLLTSSRHAIRLPDLSSPTIGIKDAAGNPIDGRGVGVAVVDSGVDGLHPDLTHRIIESRAAPVVKNFKVESLALQDQVYTDTTSGHGTHVAGIVAGQGKKDLMQRGVAPGAKVYGFGIGEVSTMLWPTQAFDWILLYGHQQDPPIRVVQNSWGTEGAYDPNSITTKLVNQMVEKGIVVVFSAGNRGSEPGDTTSRECKIPTPGVLCVGAYDDGGVGSRYGLIADFSSHGAPGVPSTYPDLVAPGVAIRSTRSPFGWNTGVGLLDYYVEMKGTSMAAPHVSGAALLMLQAKPQLTPAQAESILKSTAFKFGKEPYTDGTHPSNGYGLLDAYEAVRVAKTY